MALTEKDFKAHLKEKAIRITPLRLALIELFYLYPQALSLADIQAHLRMRLVLDRVSLYRTLRLFVEKGIIHEVLPATYLLCQHACVSHPHWVLSCYQCQRAWEWNDHSSLEKFLSLLKQQGFYPQSQGKIISLCQECQLAQK